MLPASPPPPAPENWGHHCRGHLSLSHVRRNKDSCPFRFHEE